MKGKAVVESFEAQENFPTTRKETFSVHPKNQKLIYPLSFTPTHGHVYEGHQGQKSYIGAERAQDPLYVPNLDDPIELEKLEIEDSVNKELLQKIEQLSERLRQIEGVSEFHGVSVSDLSLVPELKKPAKFKTPEFDKYVGTKCPRTHLRMYCHQMHGYEENKKLLIHYFQDSLKGEALAWYTNLISLKFNTGMI
ncbi:hypothetical protein PTKIN_Ptkin09bG0108400 [Pterospermum kingtungense]